jgi:flagellar basal body-associated protein FliL
MNDKLKVALALVCIALSLVILMVIFFGTHPKSEFEKMTLRQQEQTVMAIYEASFNTAQTNWTMTIVPRTNQ